MFVLIEGLVDLEKERARLEKKIEECERHIESLKKRLENEEFARNAPDHVIAQERGRLLDLETLLQTHQEHLSVFQ